MVEVYLQRYRAWWLNIYRWRVSAGVLTNIGLAIGMACLTGLLAQIKIVLPFSPVPITGQTFAVLVAGVMLGRYYGGFSQFIYVILGTAGVPWFNGGSGGPASLIGPTGGYLIGFIVAAFIVGYITDKYVKARNFFPMLAVMLLANFGIIYVFGLLQLSIYLNVFKGMTADLWDVLKMGAIPFIAGDIVKAILAALMAKSVLPKEPYDADASSDRRR
jgi:biotin transport system substrate-specific component